MSESNKDGSIKNSYIKLCIGIFLILLLLVTAAEFVMFGNKGGIGYLYRIEINRVVTELKNNKNNAGYMPDLSAYKTIRSVKKLDPEHLLNDDNVPDYELSESGEHYALRNVEGEIYRISYVVDLSYEKTLFCVNIIMAAAVLTMAGLMFFVYFSVIRTFRLLSGYPEELAKGHMVPPLPERRSKYFGKFLWGLDMLREKLEGEKKKNLELQKEKNVFLLSLSHDIKTPLSAIKLYAASVRKNLYKDEARISEIAGKIDDSANEIEGYISKIISASNDDFLDFNVAEGEFYLSEAIDYTKKYYSEKLKAVGTEFELSEYDDILMNGDKERFIEVMQNVFENAVKYGDGRRICVEFSDEEDCKLITITNTGCTLSQSELNHIFDSFYRGSNVGSNSGSGLGLYICKKLMLLMHGDIYADCSDGLMKVTLVCSKK